MWYVYTYITYFLNKDTCRLFFIEYNSFNLGIERLREGVNVTHDDILNTIDELVAEGKKPTMSAIREILGGSNSTILPVLQGWKNKQKIQLSKQSQKILNDFSEKFALSILEGKEEDRDFILELSSKEEQLNTAEEKIKELENKSMKLEWELDSAHKNLIEKKDEIGLLNSLMNKLSTENGKLQAENKALLAKIENIELQKDITQTNDNEIPRL